MRIYVDENGCRKYIDIGERGKVLAIDGKVKLRRFFCWKDVDVILWKGRRVA